MEKGTNNNMLNKSNSLNECQIFFLQRWLEILNVNTHSKYAIRFLNTHQALKELVFVCEGMMGEEIKSNDHHLQLVFKEARNVLMNDWLFEKKENHYFKILSAKLNSTPKVTQRPKIYSILYQINYILNDIKERYLNSIVDEIKLLFKDESSDENLTKIDYLISSLVSELIAMGWSPQRLYEIIKNDFLQSTENDLKKWDDFFSEILKEPEDYVCLFKFIDKPGEDLLSKMSQMNIDVMLGSEIRDTYSDGLLDPHIGAEEMRVRVNTLTYDHHSAVDKARSRITEGLDVLQYYGLDVPELEPRTIVINPDGKHFHRNITGSLRLQKKKSRASDATIESMRKQLNTHEHKKINNKIRSLLEFSRISEESLSSKMAFINLWIALESFVQTDENEGSFESVKKNVSAASSHNYLFTLIKNLMEDFRRCGIKWSSKISAEQRRREYDFIQILLDDTMGIKLIEECREKHVLLGYRCKQLRETLLNGKKASQLIKTHKENVEQHLQRLYRIRNGIVHTGNTPYNTNLFIQHIREYIESTISVVLYRLKNFEVRELEEVLAVIRDSVDYTIEVLDNLGQNHALEAEEYQNLLLNGAF